jgi:hypothetical protein
VLKFLRGIGVDGVRRSCTAATAPAETFVAVAMLRVIRRMLAVADWARRGLLPDGLDVDGFGVDGFQRSIAGFADGDFARRVYELNLQRAATS